MQQDLNSSESFKLWYHAQCQASWMNNGFWKRCEYGILAVFVYLPVQFAACNFICAFPKKTVVPKALKVDLWKEIFQPNSDTMMFPRHLTFQTNNPQTTVSHAPPLDQDRMCIFEMGFT